MTPVEATFRVYGIVCALAGLYFLCVSAANAIWLRQSARIKPLRSGQKVNVLVPARDEEANIAACLDGLLAQDYDNYDITVLDDDSSDRTPEILAAYAAKYPAKLKILRAPPLEPGWYGKPRAMHLLAAQADGDYFLYVDADTRHEPDALGRAMAHASRHRADLVSGYLQQVFGSFGETMVVPAIYILTALGLPLALVPYTRSPALSHAIGQFLLFRAETYRACGGYATVRDQVSDDVRMARKVKKSGGRVFFADFAPSVSVRMYSGFATAFNGVEKNIFDYFNKHFSILLLATVAVPLFFFVPAIALLWMPPFMAAARPWLAASALLTSGAWAITALDRKLPWHLPVTHHAILVNVLSMAWRAFSTLRKGGGIMWKGRLVR